MKNDLLHRYISRTLTRDGADNFENQLFFKKTYFPEHLPVAMTIKILKAMSNLIAINLNLKLEIIYTCLVVYLESS